MHNFDIRGNVLVFYIVHFMKSTLPVQTCKTTTTNVSKLFKTHETYSSVG